MRLPFTSDSSPSLDSSGVSADRRTDSRVHIDVLANRFLGGYPYLCRATDISRRGIRLQRFSGPAMDHRFVGLQFQLPGSEEVITASGEVVFDDEGSRALGIRFTALPERSAMAIERFLSHAVS
jgi:hypothetical protein